MLHWVILTFGAGVQRPLQPVPGNGKVAFQTGCAVALGSNVYSGKKRTVFFPKTLLRAFATNIRQPLTDGVWPSGKATVFGTEDRRFESYHPSQYFRYVTVMN